jgi:hypothetical protein
MEIQDFLIAAIENITILIRDSKDRMSKSNVQRSPFIKDNRAKREGCPLESFIMRLLFKSPLLWFGENAAYQH